MQLLFYLRLQDTRKKFSNETLEINLQPEYLNKQFVMEKAMYQKHSLCILTDFLKGLTNISLNHCLN